MTKKQIASKVGATLDSRNFFVSIISLILFVVGTLSGADIPDSASEELLEAITSKDLMMIFTIGLPNLINPVLKIIKEKKWNTAIFKSKNFITQASTVLLLAIAGFGIAFPDGAAASIIDSIFGGEGTVIITAFVINIINPLYHFFFDKGDDEKKPETA